jgi:hypothetical protein
LSCGDKFIFVPSPAPQQVFHIQKSPDPAKVVSEGDEKNIRAGMSKMEVDSILGEPSRIEKITFQINKVDVNTRNYKAHYPSGVCVIFNPTWQVEKVEKESSGSLFGCLTLIVCFFLLVAMVRGCAGCGTTTVQPISQDQERKPSPPAEGNIVESKATPKPNWGDLNQYPIQSSEVPKKTVIQSPVTLQTKNGEETLPRGWEASVLSVRPNVVVIEYDGSPFEIRLEKTDVLQQVLRKRGAVNN